jgi:hypothetical protein
MAASSRTLFVAAGVAGVAFLMWKYGGLLAPAAIAKAWVMNTFDRGRRLTTSTLDSAGVVVQTPGELLEQANEVLAESGDVATLDELALARMGRSEGVDGMEYRMHVALNDLDYLQGRGYSVYSSVAALMLHSKISAANGRFSRQNLGKRYATSRDAYEGDLYLARAVIADHQAGIDPTGGARKFVDIDGFATQPGASTYEDTVAAWAKEGLEPKTLPGASSNFVVFA